MPVVKVADLGIGGIVRDTPAVLLNPGVFSDGRNVRFDNAAVRKMEGHVQILPDLTGATNPHFGIHWPRPEDRYNIYANAQNIYRVDQAGNISNVTQETAPGVPKVYRAGSRWHGSLFTGGYAVVLNNTVDTPAYTIFGNVGTPDQLRFVDLPGWNYSTAFSRIAAGVLRPYRNHLVAGNLTVTSATSGIVSHNPGTVRISTAAAPGAIPQTWEPGVGDQLADEFELSQSEPIVEMGELRGSLFVYTGDSIHQINVGQSATTVRDYAYGYGCLAIDCVASFDGRHFVVDRNDVYVHTGSGQIQSVIDYKNRDYLFRSLNQQFYQNTFVVPNRAQDELWICFPNQQANAEGDCNEALIWNYRHNNWTTRDLPNARAGFQGPMVTNNEFRLVDERTIIVSRADSRFYAMDEGFSFNGAPYQAFVERKRTVASDDDTMKFIRSFYPVFDPLTTTTTEVSISFRGQDNFSDDVDLTDRRTITNTFNPSREYKIDPYVEGRLINYRLETNDTQSWTLAGVSIDVRADGTR